MMSKHGKPSHGANFNAEEGNSKIKTWIADKLTKEAIDYAENFGKHLAKNRFTSTQIRNAFGEVRRIQMKMRDGFAKVESDILLLRPKLAYSAKRVSDKNARHAAEQFSNVLGNGIVAISQEENDEKKEKMFKRFADFFEAVLAYHKAYGGN